jgi:hypothetical protein
MSVGAANPKLPLWNAICLSYSTWLHRLADVLRISWLWIALVGVKGYLQWSRLGGAVPPQTVPLESRALIYIGALIWILASISINVASYRRLVLGEKSRLSGSNIFTGSLWRYVGVEIVITLIALIPVILLLVLLLVAVVPFVSALGAPRILTGSISVIGMLGLYMVAIAVILRLSPLLPARAVGDRERTIEETWRQTRGNTWRLFWGLVACTFVPMIVVQIVVLIIFGLPNVQTFGSSVFSTRLELTGLVYVVCYMLTTPISANFLALAYLHFFKRHQIEVFE